MRILKSNIKHRIQFGFAHFLCNNRHMNNKMKNPSPLVESVLKLDNYLSEIVRLGAKIESMDLKSDFDFEQTQRLMNHFAECGQGVTDEIIQLSTRLNEARAQAEAAAAIVAARAELVQARQNEHQQKAIAFQALGAKVRDLTLSLNDLKRSEGETLSDEDRAKMSMRLTDFELQLRPLIEEARLMRQEAQASKLKALEQGADSLVQSLSAISQRLEHFNKTELAPH